jgi:hypothetical protein
MKCPLLCLSIVVPLILAGCGGGGDSASSSGSAVTMEKINGIDVPPAPPVDVNNATVTGVDVDKNGIRDDVDRFIAVSAETPQKRTSYIEVATAAQKLLSETDEAKLKELYKSLSCADLGLSSSESPVAHYAIFNTKERRAIFSKSQPEAGTMIKSTDEDNHCVSSVKPFVSEE